MAVTIDGTNGVTTPAESVTGTGVWSVGGSQIYKDASGNVGIGTGSPAYKLDVQGSIGSTIASKTAEFNAAGGSIYSSFNDGTKTWRIGVGIQTAGMLSIRNQTDAIGAVNIDSSGSLLVACTSNPSSTVRGVSIGPNGPNGVQLKLANTLTGAFSGLVAFVNGNGQVGSIDTSGSSTSYVTSSDYRLKNTIAPMTGALDKVALLKPCTYKWNTDGSDGQGFIAHELAEVEPGCVTGEKDAVDAEGKPQYQGIDTSFLVATLAAAIQEQQAIIQSLTTRITALEAK